MVTICEEYGISEELFSICVQFLQLIEYSRLISSSTIIGESESLQN